MACAPVGIYVSSPAVAATTEAELGGRTGMRRSRSEPLLRCSLRVPRSTAPPRLRTSRSIGNFPLGISGSILPSSIRSLLFDPEDDGREAGIEDAEKREEAEEEGKMKKPNWVQRICEVRSRWRNSEAKDGAEGVDDAGAVNWEEYGCGVSYESEEEEEEKKKWDREEFARLLSRAPWEVTKLFGQLAFLCNMAYVIPEIKTDDLKSYYGLRLVTSSLEKKLEAAIKVKLETDSTCVSLGQAQPERGPPPARFVRSSVAYEIAASAASYIHNRAKGLLSRGAKAGPGVETGREEAHIAEAEAQSEGRMYNLKVATYVAASSMTAVVAAEEKARLEAARDLQSLHSSPCEWFVCDEPSTSTRCFVIQGSDSLASWQANLFFEPTKFEGTEALVHRGIYEAAKGIYQQFMPEIESHLLSHGDRARFRFTGHSLGGSLSMLISLMLLARSAVPRPSLLPVVTFGSPAVFCGGHRALHSLGLDETHICAVMMHRDIVPRAFSCDYPGHVAVVLKRLNSSFGSHPCLNTEKLLYSPLGKQYILQPDEKVSPPHPMLPHGAAMYVLEVYAPGALQAFMNTPHPLETLSHPAAYGSDGTILRDHDSSNYIKAVNGLLRQHTRSFVRRSRRQRLRKWWPIVTAPASAHGSLPVHAWPAHHHEPAKEVASGA